MILFTQGPRLNHRSDQSRHGGRLDVSKSAQRTHREHRAHVRKPRGPRINFSRAIVDHLLFWFNAHLKYPYPSPEVINELAMHTKLRVKQVTEWFTRQRKLRFIRPHVTPRRSSGHGMVDSASTGQEPSHPPSGDWSTSLAFQSVAETDGKALSNIDETEDTFALLQEQRQIRSSISPMERYLKTDPRDEGSPVQTCNSVQSNVAPHFIPYRHEHALTHSRSVLSTTLCESITCQEEDLQSVPLSSQQSHHSNQSSGTALQLPRQKGRRIIRPDTMPPKREGNKRFQCTWCNMGFEFQGDWSRHEEFIHAAQPRCVCMRYGPRLVTTGNVTCPFCGIPAPTDDHLTSEHKAFLCLEKPENKRVFTRPDGLMRHMRQFHKAIPSIRAPPESWMVPMDEYETRPYWCGFCSVWLGTVWQRRVTHISNHYNDPNNCFDMAQWTPEPTE